MIGPLLYSGGPFLFMVGRQLAKQYDFVSIRIAYRSVSLISHKTLQGAVVRAFYRRGAGIPKLGAT
jgi:hypothetical protein